MEKGWPQDLEPVGMLLRGVTLGDEVEHGQGDVAVDGDAALFERRGNWLKAVAWRSEDVLDQVEALRSRQRFVSPSFAHSTTRRYRQQR